MGPYPPPPPGPGAQPPPGLYPGPGQPFPHYAAPPPPFPAGYPPSAYPFPPHQFVPTTAYGQPHYGQPGRMGPPAPLTPSGSFAPPGRPAAHEYRQPLPPYHQPYSHKSTPSKRSPSGPPHVRPDLPSPRSTPIPPKPPSARISHPLPPKPPPSHDQMKPGRDLRNRRKPERQNHQEKRHKAYGRSRASPSPGASSHHHPQGSSSATDRYPPSRAGETDHAESGTGPCRDSRSASGSPERKSEACEEDGARTKLLGKTSTKSDASAGASAACERNEPSAAVEAAPARSLEEAERPAPGEKPSSAGGRAWDSVGDDGEAAHSPEASDEHEDGEIASDEDVSSPAGAGRALSDERRRSPAAEEQWRRKRVYSDELDDDEDDERRAKKFRANRPRRLEDRAGEDDGVDGNIWDSLDVPRQADRKRRGSTASRGSRHSTVSSKSSDLNSLEAELLGRPVKARHAEPSPPSRSRLERRAPSKPKRRQANTNSAYSRRW
ncbi:hypothetical protein CDD83_5143 [Cordyceps sp. RAO-2017]|nr:hypothetical protein CDD83_5143 [Cordyceps sp. RAO-2017]